MLGAADWGREYTHTRVSASEKWLVAGLLLIAIAARLLVAGGGTLLGDMRDWQHWSHQLTSAGFRQFYPRTGSDYLPIYPYILWMLGELYGPVEHLAAGALGWQLSRTAVFKLPAISADVATVWLLYFLARRWGTPLMAGIASTTYALNPGVIANSARWGQVDSIPTLFMLAAVALLIEQHYLLCGVLLSLSVFTKPTALILAPLIVVVLLRRRQARGLLRLSGAFLVTSLLIIVPFIPVRSNLPAFVIQRFAATTGTWSYATMNAFNLWGLRQGDVAMVPDSRTWLGLSTHTWGWVLLAVLAAFACALAGKWVPEEPEQRARVILPAACVLVFAFFMVLTRIHERHLLPTLPLLALTSALWWRFWPLYAWLSIAYLLNLHFFAHGLFAMPEPLLGSHEVVIMSTLNLCALIAMAALTARTLYHNLDIDRISQNLLHWASQLGPAAP